MRMWGVLLAAILLLSPLTASDAGATCSPYVGRATINETYNGSNPTFIEIKLLQSDLSVTDWTVRLCNQSTGCASFSMNSAVANGSYRVLYIGDAYRDYLNFKKDKLDILLTDASGYTVDYFSVAGAAYQSAACTSLIYPTTYASYGNSFSLARSPDGTGAWGDLGPGNSGNESPATTNDSSSLPQLSVADVTVNRGSTATFTLKLSSSSTSTITVAYRTWDGSAVTPTDYTSTTGTATFSAGTTQKTVSVPTKATSTAASGSFFWLEVYNPVNVSLVNHYAKGTINVVNLLDHFTISHSGAGVTCQAEPVTITAHSAAHLSYLLTGTSMTLSTSTGRGDWSKVSGNGTLVNSGSGSALYTFSAESSVVLNLKYPYAETVNINLVSGSVTEHSGTAEPLDANLVFAEAGFRFVDGTGSETIGTQLAGKDSNVAPGAQSLFLQAIRTDTRTGTCVGAFGGQTLSIELAGQCLNPTTSAGRQVSINGTTIASNPATAVASYTSVDLTFDSSSQAPVTINYPDVGRLSLSARYNIPRGTVPASLSGQYMVGSSNAFVVKPYGFSLSNIIRTSDSFANPVAVDADDSVFIQAGMPFSATVTATTLSGSAAPNYGQETVPEGVTLTSALVLPAAGVNPALSNASAFATFSGGSATGTTFAWDEVGIITLTPAVADGDYLGAGTVTGTASGNVGRFIPFDFSVVTNAPELAPACGRFTYLGQPFSYDTAPVITVTARNAGGVKTANYTGDFWKLDNSSLSGKSYLAATGTLDISLLPAVDPVIVDNGDGTGTLTFSSGGGLGFVRSTPEVPFDAEISLQIDVQDSDSVAFAANPAAFGSASAGNGIDFSIDPLDATQQLKQMRFGRMYLQNAYGSELVPLQLPLRAEYYDASGFVTNTDDGCSSYDGTLATLGNYQLNLNDPETTVSGAGSLIAGLSDSTNPLQLSAPGATNDGSVDVTLPVEFWLRYDWDGDGSHDNDPTGRGSFGIYSGNPRMIYTRETVR